MPRCLSKLLPRRSKSLKHEQFSIQLKAAKTIAEEEATKAKSAEEEAKKALLAAKESKASLKKQVEDTEGWAKAAEEALAMERAEMQDKLIEEKNEFIDIYMY